MVTGIRIVVPTMGDRLSLRDTLDSLATQTRDDDTVYLISDTVKPLPELRLLTDYMGSEHAGTWIYDAAGRHYGDWGHTPRNIGIDSFPDGATVWTLDDDDVAAPVALESIRQAVAEYPGRLLVFRMWFGPGHFAYGMTLWRQKRLRHGEVGTPMLVAPKGAARFASDYSGDWAYAEACQAEYGAAVFVDRLVAQIRPVVQPSCR